MQNASLSTRAKWSFAHWLEIETDRAAFHCGAHSATRAQLLHASQRAAAHLSTLGFRRGDVLALWIPDGGCWLQFLFAAAQLGVLVVPISTRYRRDEARHVLATSRARGLVVSTDFLGFDYAALARAIQADLPHLQHLMSVRTGDGFFVVDATLPAVGATGTRSDPLCTFSTSGTTGSPKLAVHDQGGIALHGENVAAGMDIRQGDRMLCALSLYGVLGFVQAMAALAGGAACVFLQVYNAQAAAGAIEKYGVTHFFGADGIFDPVLNTRGHSLASWRCGGFAEFAGLGAKVVAQAEHELGLRLIAIYGSSECFAIAAAQSPGHAADRRVVPGGTPIADGIEFRVVDADTGEPVGDDVRGELQIRGYNVMSGYLNNPVATEAALTRDGWFRTGDLAYRKGSEFVYLARLKDGLRLRGYLVEPAEIEEFLKRHEAVADVQVVGINRIGEGDIAIAFVRVRGESASEPDILAWCKAGIANYKVPRRVLFVDAFPQVEGPNGTKILKNKLREMAEQAVGSAATT